MEPVVTSGTIMLKRVLVLVMAFGLIALSMPEVWAKPTSVLP